jgi:hypothetical protein
MKFAVLSFILCCRILLAQHDDTKAAMLARLAREADLFERLAHRVQGKETLRQTLPHGTNYARGPRDSKIITPEVVHEIVSKYGFLPVDEKGGSIREARMVLMVDGLRWSRGKKSLDSLAEEITVQGDKQSRRLLERWEEFGLRGFITDLGPLILLFARGNTKLYEFTFLSTDTTDPLVPINIYRYRQIEGPEKFTIHSDGQPIRQRMEGRVWVNAADQTPVRISFESNHDAKHARVHDVSIVNYEQSDFGCLLPVHITHQQFVDGELFVFDDFVYSDYKQVVPGSGR